MILLIESHSPPRVLQFSRDNAQLLENVRSRRGFRLDAAQTGAQFNGQSSGQRWDVTILNAIIATEFNIFTH